MATPLYTPRVNNNDDTVRLIRLSVKAGDAIRSGEPVAEVETDKANFTVEADHDGYVLAISHAVDDMVDVGSVLLWIGSSPDEPVPADTRSPRTAAAAATVVSGGVATVAPPTLKAAQLLARHGLRAEDVPAAGERLTVADIEAFLATRGAAESPAATGAPRAPNRHPPADGPKAPGVRRPMTTDERGMLRTVSWQRDEAVPGYVEIQYDPAPWSHAAEEYQKSAGLLLSPLLPLMAYRLVRLAAEHERWNSTIVGQERLMYGAVNLGVTVQSDDRLYLVVLQDAATLSCAEFVARLGQLQRRALAQALRAEDLSGATIAFSSMARWQVSRHVPVLPPYTSLIVAHAGTANGIGTLGATYDHRVLTGFDALSALRALACPEEIA
jgi:pyruvate/2-oxoglutarate dehydrogenase complex dihydrolipoamide acyltransferase (E2) component